MACSPTGTWENRRFAEMAEQCENVSMKKLYIMAVTILAAGMMLHGNALAQQPPASNSFARALRQRPAITGR